jgi:fatty acid synthase subunit alpha, fungi type
MQYNIDQCDPSKGETYELAKQFGQQLIENTREVIGQPPVYKHGALLYYDRFSSSDIVSIVTFVTVPQAEVTAKGDIVYSEVIRENVHKLEAYVEEMASG